MKNEIESKVVDFVADFVGYKSEEVTLSSTLGKDLGMDGDDARKLLQEFSQRFDVDMSSFKFEQYFGNERPMTIISFLGALIWPRKTNLAPLTIGDLVRAAQIRKLKVSASQ